MKHLHVALLILSLFLFVNPSEAQKDTIKNELNNTNDWPNLRRYRSQNAALTPQAHRVVFMGNSITDAWINFSPDFFSKNPYVDRGISGQTTPQMLVRFRQDVIDLKPEVVVILAGINDIAGNTGPSSLEMIEDNISSMSQLAKINGIKVVLSSVLPAFSFPWRPGIDPVEKITELNKWLKDYADKNGYVYLDYYSSLVDERKGLNIKYTKDGVHPNLLGYKIMEPLAEKAIARVVKQK